MLTVLGLCFDLLAIRQFHRAHTTINPLSPVRTSVVVQDGIYKVSRNPMYVGMLLLLAAWAVYPENWVAFLPLALFVVLIVRLQILPEERILQQRFGQAYADYRHSVRRWLW